MKLTFLQPTKHGGKRREIGESVEVDDALAQDLIEAGLAEPQAKAKAKAKAQAQADADAKAQADADAKAKADADAGGAGDGGSQAAK